MSISLEARINNNPIFFHPLFLPYWQLAAANPARAKTSVSGEVGKVISVEGDLPGTDLSLPSNEITQHLDLLPTDKNAEIVLNCRSSQMSTIAAKD